MKDDHIEFIELATLAFLELTPSLGEQIRLLIPATTPCDQADVIFRQKAWAELCQAAKQAGMQPLEYGKKVIVAYRNDVMRNRRPSPVGPLLKLVG